MEPELGVMALKKAKNALMKNPMFFHGVFNHPKSLFLKDRNPAFLTCDLYSLWGESVGII
jgi:hypothetical protein